LLYRFPMRNGGITRSRLIQPHWMGRGWQNAAFIAQAKEPDSSFRPKAWFIPAQSWPVPSFCPVLGELSLARSGTGQGGDK
jgi:hypothetical protein